MEFQGKWLYVYLLIEFRSTVDRFMALRLMVYVGLLYQHLIREKQIRRGGQLPPVLPIVLYNGERQWTAPLGVADLVLNTREGLERYRPRMRYLLLDQQTYQDTDLVDMRNLTAAVFRLEKSRTAEDVYRVVAALEKWLSTPAQAELRRSLVDWLHAVLMPRRIPETEISGLDDLQEFGAMLKERVKQWEREWERRGLEKGLEKGIEKGETHVLLRQLEQKFGPLNDEVRQRVGVAKSDQLLVWAERVLTAERIEDVFA